MLRKSLPFLILLVVFFVVPLSFISATSWMNVGANSTRPITAGMPWWCWAVYAGLFVFWLAFGMYGVYLLNTDPCENCNSWLTRPRYTGKERCEHIDGECYHWEEMRCPKCKFLSEE